MPGTADWYAQPRDRSWRTAAAPADVLGFHRGLSGYSPTPLTELPDIATELGVRRVFVKDESQRMGLPSFKTLGASWAAHRALVETESPRPVLFVTATDGNHGRALARAARQLGQRAQVFVAAGVHPAAADAIRAEGALVTQTSVEYDDAVAMAARAADRPGAILVQDMAWPGYQTIPAWIVQGYSTLVREVDDQLTDAGEGSPDLVVVPVGVGSLAQAVVNHYRSRDDPAATALLTVEPRSAAGLLTSLRADRLTRVPTGTTRMAGLNCGTPSEGAWPDLRAGIDAAVAVDETEDLTAVRDLHRLGVRAGPCGAAALAAARAALTGPGSPDRRAAVRVDGDSVVVLLSTEGEDANPTTDVPAP